jgi:hypothetical protein
LDTTADSFHVSPQEEQLWVVEQVETARLITELEGLSDEDAERLLAGEGQRAEA